jgi:hypothetical protein
MAYDEALKEPHARTMEFSGRPMKGCVLVHADGFDSDAELEVWVNRTLEFVATLPPK